MINSLSDLLSFCLFRFYREYRDRYDLNSNFESSIRNESNAWLKEYLAKEFNSFLESMGGWDDIHDYKSSVKFNATVSDNIGILSTVGVAMAVAGVGVLLTKSLS